MLRFLLAAAPYLLKAPAQKSQKQIARSLTALVLFALSGFTFAAAIFVIVTSYYGAAVGFLSVSILFLLAGLLLFVKAKRGLDNSGGKLSSGDGTDPVASLIPDSVLKDPTVSRLMSQISENPIASSVAAASIAMLVTREFMKD